MSLSNGRAGTSLALMLLLALGLAACATPIRYRLRENTAPRAERTLPLTVIVHEFTDARPAPERARVARRDAGGRDLSDYTYDDQFRGTVAGGVSAMLAEHLRHSRVFQEVLPASGPRPGAAVISGELRSFYGYYDRNVPRTLMYTVPLAVASAFLLNTSLGTNEGTVVVYWYGPGMLLGYYLESRHSRNMAYATELHVNLSCGDGLAPVWSDTFRVAHEARERRGGTHAVLALESLRQAVNAMVTGLAQSQPSCPQSASR